MRKHYVFLALILGWMSTAHAQGLVGDSARGETAFKQTCRTCHSLTGNKTGPTLDGLVGRKAGSVADFNYSAAVKASDIVWNEQTLDQWLSGPQKLIPGQRMNISVNDAQKRADIIAYLKNPPSKD